MFSAMKESVQKYAVTRPFGRDCKIQFYPETGGYCVSSREEGLILKGQRGNWAEVFQNDRPVYSVFACPKGERVLYGVDGEEIIRWSPGVPNDSNYITADNIQDSCPAPDFLPMIGPKSALPSASDLALLLCSNNL